MAFGKMTLLNGMKNVMTENKVNNTLNYAECHTPPNLQAF
jgi:hypothetical protein